METGKPKTAKEVTVYSDGACRGNPGPGGWGAIIVYNGVEKVLSGGEAQTTNNRMELLGVISALRALNQPCSVRLVSDSKYVTDAIKLGWARKWRERGWKRADNSPAANPDLWGELLLLSEKHNITCEWVKGHAGHPFNERCDALATGEADRCGSQGHPGQDAK